MFTHHSIMHENHDIKPTLQPAYTSNLITLIRVSPSPSWYLFPNPLNSSNAYYMQSHHCYQCSLDFHRSGERRGYTDHCCIGKLHFGRKLYKI